MRDPRQRTFTIEQLISAIQENKDIVEIRQIISGIENINQVTNYGRTALYWAAKRGYVEIVGQLLAADGIDVDKATTYGVTPLLIAAKRGHLEVVGQLLAADGIEVNQADQDGTTPLYWAACKNNIEMVKELIALRANPHQVANNGRTALYFAARNNNIEMVMELLAYGADETSLTEAQQTHFAAVIAEGKALLIRNTRKAACALADTGRELKRVSIMQNHKCRKPDVSQQDENKLPEFTEAILAQIAAYATDIQRPNSLTQDKITKCAEVGTGSLEGTDLLGFFHHEAKFVVRNPGNTINNILKNGSQNPTNGQGLGG